MHEVWQTLLEETDKVGKTRLQASEIYSQQISDSSKVVRGLKVHVAKKVFESLTEIQKDLSMAIQELVKLQKTYKDEEHIAHDARVKANDAEEKVKKKSVGLFTSFSKLQQQSAKLNSRKDACESKSTAARNEYLLSLVSINAQLNRYYNKDAPELIKAMDGEIYEKMQEYFTAFCQAELQSCGTTQECFMRILADSTKVNRDFQLKGFLVDNPIFTDLIQYQFQPQDNDLVGKVSISFQNSSVMEAEARRCAGKLVQVDREARVMTRKLTSMQTHTSTDQNAETSHSEPHVKVEEMKQLIRKCEIEKVRMEARLEAIKTAGINTQAFVMAAKAESKTPEHEEEPTIPSAPEATHKSDDTSPLKRLSFKDSSKRSSYNNDNVIAATFNNVEEPPQQQQQQQQQHDVFSNGWDQPDKQTATAAVVETVPVAAAVTQMDKQESFKDSYTDSSDNKTTSIEDQHQQQQQQQQQHEQYDVVVTEEVGQESLALFSFEGTGENELDFKEGDILETLGEVEDGWIRAKDSTGKVGLIPAAYVQIGSTTRIQQQEQQPEDTTDQYNNNINNNININDVTNNKNNEFDDPWNEMNGNAQTDVGFTDNFAAPTQEPSNNLDDTDFEVQDTLTQPLPVPTIDKVWARALYDYYATNDEELTFNEGQLIQVLRKKLHDGVDDGWWEGEVNGKVGVFPSLVVQEENADGVVNGNGNGAVSDDEEDEVVVEANSDPSRPGPPQFAPPLPDPDVIENGDLPEFPEAPKDPETPKDTEFPKEPETVMANGTTKPAAVVAEPVKETPPENGFDPQRPPTPPPPLEQTPQLEITIPTPTEGGKAASELLQAHSLACTG